MTNIHVEDLPGANCGVCGSRTCADMANRLETDPSLIRLCLPFSRSNSAKAVLANSANSNLVTAPSRSNLAVAIPTTTASDCAGCTTGAATLDGADTDWKDSLGREFDFYLEHFPEEPGPREIIIPHNPMLTRELEITVGDILIGRPLGMSCGCPITHCGVVMDVDLRTGVIVWCVTGPLLPRQQGFKDLGYYIAEGYEGLITQARCELKIGARYFFQPRMCMLQWRHSGLINYINRTSQALQVRVEGLWIG